jgi:predicted ATPase
MRIESLKYRNSFQEWEFEKIDFFDLTLLVGISGVGKTQILRSINSLKAIADGQSLNGIEWEVAFSTVTGNKYLWLGAFAKDTKKNELADLLGFEFDEERKVNKPRIISEKILKDGQSIIDRDETKFIFNGNEMPKLSSTESALNILKEEESISPAYKAFQKIVFRDHTEKEGRISFRSHNIEKFKDKYKTIDEIKESDLDTIVKLSLVYENAKSVFTAIKETFIGVFDQVEDVRIESFKDSDMPIVFEAPILQIKERGVDKWIPQNRISSGMLRTLIHISEMYLWSDGTVILIDEFENSLGVNCINVLTEDLIFRNNNLQFIATSHHPYIISKIPYHYWKIVTRKGGIIKTYDAKDFDLGEDSHHDRFMNLINLPAYKAGIEA